MKKYLVLIAIGCLSLLAPLNVFAIGTCTQALSDTTDITTNAVVFKTLTFVCTADSSAGTFPSTAVSSDLMAELKGGWMLMTGSVLNGATGMTANSTLTLSTTNEGDILGGAGKGPTAATAALTSKFTPITDTTYATGGLVPITAALTLQVTQAGSAVNSAIATIVFKFVK